MSEKDKNILVEEVNQKSKMLETSQCSLDKAGDEAHSTQQTYSSFETEAVTEIDEHDVETTMCENKIHDLQQKLDGKQFSDKDQIKALEKENRISGGNIQEAREQDSSIRSESTEQIDHLKSLIANLEKQLEESNAKSNTESDPHLGDTVRSKIKTSSSDDEGTTTTTTQENTRESTSTTLSAEYSRLPSLFNLVVGIAMASYLGYSYYSYVKLLHENEMWFSNIKQVEREISFRTESGLYFSYYKTLVLAPSVKEGVRRLMYNNITEYQRTINILERFNIYQEVVLGILYKSMPLAWQKSVEYVYFYLNAIYGLHGVYMGALFVTTWVISGSSFAGVLSNAFYVFNRIDMTRLTSTAPLRESFSLPFIYLQLAAVTFYFKTDDKSWKTRAWLWLFGMFTILLTITWQFAQFVLLLEGVAFFALYALQFVNSCKVRDLFVVFLVNLSCCCLLQFGNDMLYTSLVASFSVAALLVLTIQSEHVSGGVAKKIVVLLTRIVVVLGLTFLINFLVKKIARVDSDEHVFKFVKAKLGYGEVLKKDFDALVYLCEGAFQYLPLDTFPRLTDGFVLPVYVAGGGTLFILLLISYGQKLWGLGSKLDDYPDLVFHIILSVLFGAMALTTVRMKFLWLPHMCIVAAGVFCHQDTWKTCLSRIYFPKSLNWLVRHSIPVLLVSMLAMKKLPGLQEELGELREFHDPDTVELMEWIQSSTPKRSVFTGSMQLMAAVKLSTDRAITNHPHYENKFLRERTKQVYQVYARREPEYVYKILKKHGSTHIILEHSICLSQQQTGCRLKDILDLDNGLPVNAPRKAAPPRFCEAIRYNHKFMEYFQLVFENHTFYLYRLK